MSAFSESVVFTIQDLARRWRLSESKLRKMRPEELPRRLPLGGRLVRFSERAVADFEQSSGNAPDPVTLAIEAPRRRGRPRKVVSV
jgi:predicted DNA-binding transcriptional regulator AlpA